MFLFQEHCTLPITGLEKTSRPGHVRGHLYIARFCDDPQLCPVFTLTEYYARVRYIQSLWVFLLMLLFRQTSYLQIASLSSFLSSLLTRLSHPRHSLGGPLIYSQMPVWTQRSSKLTLLELRPAISKLGVSPAYRFASWQTGAPPAVSTRNFIYVMPSEWLYCLLSSLLHLPRSQYTWTDWFSFIALTFALQSEFPFAMNTLLSLRQFQSSCFVKSCSLCTVIKLTIKQTTW